MSTVLEVENLHRKFPLSGGRYVHAVNSISFRINEGETVGMVGESGSGKSTVGRLVLRLLTPTEGSIRFQGKDITSISERQCRSLRGQMQIVFQDPWAALNPRLTARTLIAEPLLLHTALNRKERNSKVNALAERVQLSQAMLDRYPGELSGGQLQRICIARAIATEPKLIVLDEPTSSLDLSVRAGILALLQEIRKETGVAMLFISHDLGTLKLISDRVLVVYLGRIVETGPSDELFENPRHPYSRALLSAHLPADPDFPLSRQQLEGETPSPIKLPMGCGFASRCPMAQSQCTSLIPDLQPAGNQKSHLAACIRL